MTESTALICPRHKVETPLTCVTCETPICPQCYVRTAVGLRCPVCAQGITVKIGRRRIWPIAVGVLLIAAVAALILALTGSGGGGSQTVSDADVGADQTTAGSKVISRPAQGFSVEVPTQWLEAADNSATTLSYASPRSSDAWLRVSVNRSDAPLADSVARLVQELTNQGGQNFAQAPAQVSGVPAIRLTYRFPTSSTPGSTIASRTSYLVINKGNLYSFQQGTTDPSANESVFAFMASKFTLL